jgi:predicted component of type VI protein secretion system
MHCEVSISDTGIWLTDKGSSFGTFLLDGRKLNVNESVRLNYGDIFYLADNNNEFKIGY